MNLSDEIMLAKLRKYTRLTSDQWFLLEAEIVKAGGILKATGTAHSELMFCASMAVEPVEKHPGHANQSSHGNGGSKGGATGGSHQVTLMPQGGGNTKLAVETESVHPSKLVAGDIVMTPEKTLMSVNGGKTRAVTQGGGGNGGPGTDNTSHFLDGSPVIGLGNAGYLISSGSVADRPRGSTKGDWDKMRSIDLGYGKSGSGSTDNLRVNRVTSVNGKDPKGSVL